MSVKSYDDINPEIKASISALKKLITKRLEDNPNGGMLLNKGKSNEAKVRYKDLLDFVHALDNHLGKTGLLSMGSCKSCKHCDKKCHTSLGNCAGTCVLTGKSVDDLTCCTRYSER